MCIVFSIIEYVYWCLGVIFIEYVRYWEFVCELFEIPCYLYCLVISICERDEWPSPKDSESLSFPSLYSLLMWLHFMFDLSRSPHFFTYSLFRCRFYRCLWFISFPSHLISLLTATHLGFDTHFASSLHISLLVHFASFVSLSTSYSR